MKRKTFVPDAEPAPIRLKEGGFVAGLLRGIETVEDELVATIVTIWVMRVSVPLELEGKLRALVGKEAAVLRIDDEFSAVELPK